MPLGIAIIDNHPEETMQKSTLTVLVTACLSTAAVAHAFASDADAMLDMKERGGKLGTMLNELYDRHTGRLASGPLRTGDRGART